MAHAKALLPCRALRASRATTPARIVKWRCVQALAVFVCLLVAGMDLALSSLPTHAAEGASLTGSMPASTDLRATSQQTGTLGGDGRVRPQVEADPGGGTTVTNTTTNIITYNASTFFPSATVSQTILSIALGVVQGMASTTAPAIQAVLEVSMFGGRGSLGSVELPQEITDIGHFLRQAAVVLWVLGIVLIALDLAQRNMGGRGVAAQEVVERLMRAVLVIIFSASGVEIVALAHRAIGSLTTYIWGILFAGVLPVDRWASRFTAPMLLGADIGGQILALVVLTVVGMTVVVVMVASYIARYTFLLAIGALAPLALATENIPLVRFVARGWLAMFLKMELVQILNAVVMIVFVALAFVLDVGDPIASVYVRIAGMVGLASALIAINMSIFRDMFGTAIDVGSGIARLAGVALGLVATGGLSAPAGLAMAGSGAGSSGAAPVLASDSAAAAPPSAAAIESANQQAVLGARNAAYARLMSGGLGDPFSGGLAVGTSVGAQLRQLEARQMRDASDGAASGGQSAQPFAGSVERGDAAMVNGRADSRSAAHVAARALAPDDAPLRADLELDMLSETPGPRRDAVVGAYRGVGQELCGLNARLHLGRDGLAQREGFASYRDMARSLASDRMQPEAPAGFWQSKLDRKPETTDPDWPGETVWDRAQAVVTLRSLAGDERLIPDWSAAIADTRREIGADALSGVLAQARADQVDEATLRNRVDAALEAAPVPGTIRPFWRTSADTTAGQPAGVAAPANRGGDGNQLG